MLVWGPGRNARSDWYDKRLRIVEALKEIDQRFAVTTSEDIFDEDPPEDRDNLEAAQLELLHAKVADLIIALVIGSPKTQGGVYRELDIISQYRDLRDRTWIFLPTRPAFFKQFQSGSLLNFRKDHLIRYTKDVFEQCDNIRKTCTDKAKEEHHQLLLDQLQAFVRR